MFIFNIIWLLVTVVIAGLISYKSLETFNGRFTTFIFANLFLAICGILLSIFLFGSYFPFFFLGSFFAGFFAAIIGMSLKNVLWHTKVIYEEEEEARLEAIKNNPYYQQAHDEINDIVNGKEKQTKINLNK